MITERLKEEDYPWAVAYLIGKLLWLYNKMDPNNLERNWQNFEEELNQELKNLHDKE